jgi:hypothetical protein
MKLSSILAVFMAVVMAPPMMTNAEGTCTCDVGFGDTEEDLGNAGTFKCGTDIYVCPNVTQICSVQEGTNSVYYLISQVDCNEMKKVEIGEKCVSLVGYGVDSSIVTRALSDRVCYDHTSDPGMKEDGQCDVCQDSILIAEIDFFANEDVATEATVEAVTEPPAEPAPTDPPATKPPATDPPVTDPPITDPPVPATEELQVAEIAAVVEAVTEEPQAVVEAVTDPPVTDPPVTDPPVTDPPVTDPPVTDPPVTDPLVTDPLVTDPPATDTPVPVPATEELQVAEIAATEQPTPITTCPDDIVLYNQVGVTAEPDGGTMTIISQNTTTVTVALNQDWTLDNMSIDYIYYTYKESIWSSKCYGVEYVIGKSTYDTVTIACNVLAPYAYMQICIVDDTILADEDNATVSKCCHSSAPIETPTVCYSYAISCVSTCDGDVSSVRKLLRGGN